MPTPLRNIRVPDEVWHPAMERAKAAGKSLTEVLVEFLRTYGTAPAPMARTHKQALPIQQAAAHEFKPSRGSTLRCETCGRTLKDH